MEALNPLTPEPLSPPAPNLADLSAVDAAGLLRARHVKPTEVLAAVNARMEAIDPLIHAVLTSAMDRAHAQASVLDDELPDPRRPLWGVPVTVKDLTPTAGISTTRGLKLRSRWAPDIDAAAVERLRAAGAIVIAKTNTSEEGWKAETSNRLGPPTLNPWDLTSSAGGSSGGAAAAVACGFGPIGTGTDGAGSVRIPASFCGVVGFKPTFGAIPYWPGSPEGLSHLGPLARTVADISVMFETLAGRDHRDPTSDIDLPPASPTNQLRIGVIRGSADWPTDPAVSSAFDDLTNRCAAAGLRLEEAPELPCSYGPLEVALSAFEAAPYAGGGLDGDAPFIDPGRLAVIERGLRLSAAQLARAIGERLSIVAALGRYWGSHDVLLMPSTPVISIAPGSTSPKGPADVVDRLRWACFSYPWNLTGDPACSLPVLPAPASPIGAQLVAPRRADRQLLHLAGRLETAGLVGAAWPPLVAQMTTPPSPHPGSGPSSAFTDRLHT